MPDVSSRMRKTDMRNAPSRAADAYGLSAYLRGDRAAPARASYLVEPLRLLCEAVCSAQNLHPHVLEQFGVGHGDAVLRWDWYAACTLVADFDSARGNRKRHRHAETTARVRCEALLKRCLARIEHLQGRVDFWPNLDVSDVLLDYRLLAGVLSLCLAECGYTGALDYIREEAGDLLQEGEGNPALAAVVLGLTGEHRETYRDGQGALGILAWAIENGQALLKGATRDLAIEDDLAERVASIRKISRQQPEPEESEPFAVAAPLTPALAVFPDMSHLPGKKRSDSTLSHTQQSPLTEHGHLAKKLLGLVQVPDLAVFVAALDAEFPWYRKVTRSLAADLGRGRFARFRNVLLHGKPGSAKTRYARRVLELAGLQTVLYSAAGASDSTWGSTSRQWSTGRLSTVAGLIARVQQANVGVVLDELDKLPPPGVGGQNGRLDEVLLPFLESTSAKALFDSYVECALDLSAVSYIATANDLSRVSGPLRDRFRLIKAPLPTVEDLPVIVSTIHREILTEQGLDPAWAEPLAQDEIDILASRWRGGSLRGLRRMVEVLVDGRPAGAAH